MHLRNARTPGVIAVVALMSGAMSTALAGTATASAASASTSRIVIGLRAAATSAAAVSLERRLGLVERSANAALHSRVVTAHGDPLRVLTSLKADPAVAYAELDAVAEPTDVTPNDPYFPTGAGALSGGEWGSAKTQAPAVWGVTTGSSNVTVAVIDSGVVASQPDLAPVLVPGWNVLTGTSNTADTYGHGTEVAGVAVAASNNGQGVAAYCWACKLMPVKVYNTASAYASDIANGMVWAVDHGAKVENISLATTTSSSALTNAVSYATSHGVTVVAAAGNFGTSTPTYPASIPGVISVAASDQTDTLYSYSDYGSWVDVAAPGATVTTLPNGAYGAVGGTSIASPAVAGIVGLLLSHQPTATPAQLADAITSTTDPTAGTKTVRYGRINAYRALTALGAVGTTPPPPPPPPALTTYSVTGSLTKAKPSAVFTFAATGVPAASRLTFPTSCTGLTLTIKSASGTQQGTVAGPSVLTATTALTAGSYTWTVSGSCRVSFTLSVTA